ncbi:hypothetical protein TNCV_1221431 [Trichonephila clavipes]|nr:hypothetical protein TNCV_1221431 [Trichonephila clavipes]
MFDGLVVFAVDRWCHDCGVRRVWFISWPGSPMNEERFGLATFRSERGASTLPITPRQPSSRDVGTSSYDITLPQYNIDDLYTFLHFS